MNSCILLSSCDRYAPLAKLTLRFVSQRWPDHPPVWTCGCSEAISSNQLLLVDDPKDWVGITATAVSELQMKGYDCCYLILDDHPPLGPCHAGHLNITIPGLVERFDAACVSLYGWDQRTKSSGVSLGREFYFLQKQNEDFLWRFSLHPALWQISALLEILSLLEPIPRESGSRSIWAFERRSGAPNFPLSARWQRSSYRINGLNMLGGERPKLRSITRKLVFIFHDFLRLGSRLLQGKEGLARLDRKLAFQHYYFDGPYPMFWSGVLQKGVLNKEFIKFLDRQGRRNEILAFQRATDELSAQ